MFVMYSYITIMIFSLYNKLSFSEKYGFLIFNTRTKFFAKISEELFVKLDSIVPGVDIELSNLNFPKQTLEKLLSAKVFVEKNEDEDFYNLKKYLRYNKAFSAKSLGLVLVPTLSCNFKCPYCYEGGVKGKSMDTNVIEHIIEFVKRKDPEYINLCWHGGEPLVAFDKIICILYRLKNEVNKQIKTHSMVTNGYLLDKDKCKKLNEYNINHIQVTLDGNREFHNKSRLHKQGLPTFDKIIENIDNVFTYMSSCHVTIRINLRQENKYLFPDLYADLKKRWKNQNYTINIAFVNDISNSCNVACLPEKGKISFLKEMYEKYGIDDIKADITSKVGGCTATSVNSIIIGPEGEIYKCWVDVGRKDRIVSNVFDGTLNNYILPSYTVGADMFSDEKCHRCTFLPICDGGCVVRRFNRSHHGIPYSPCPVDNSDLDSLLELYALKSEHI